MNRSRLVVTSLAAASAFAAALVACSSSAGEAPASGDGSVPDGSTSDAPSETSTQDGGPGFIPCAERTVSPLSFCDDFDHAGRLELEWSFQDLLAGGAVIAAANPLSPPRAMGAQLPASTGASSSARFIKDLSADVAGRKKLSLSFALRWDVAPYLPDASGASSVTVGSISFDDATCDPTDAAPSGRERSISLVFFPPNRLRVALRSFTPQCSDGGADFVSLLTTLETAHFRNFRRMNLVVSAGGCPGEPPSTASVTVGADGLAGSSCLPVDLDPFANAKKLSFSVGLSGSGARDAAQATFDDVAFDVE
jgi:hypothetical protein